MAVLTLVVFVKVADDGVSDLRDYEAAVLPLVLEHGGNLQRRLRTSDGVAECHILQFPSWRSFENFRTDARRADAAPLLASSGAVIEVFEMTDVGHDL